MKLLFCLAFSQIIFSFRVDSLTKTNVDCYYETTNEPTYSPTNQDQYHYHWRYYTTTTRRPQIIIKGNITFNCDGEQEIRVDNDSEDMMCPNIEIRTVSQHNIIKVNFDNCQMPKLNMTHDVFQVYNQLTDLDVSNMSLNGLQSETFMTAVNLKKFSASHNNISDIPALLFLHAENMVEVDFSHNKIKKLDSFALSGAKKLMKMDFSFNQLEKVSGLVLGNVLTLEDMNLAHNNIKKVEPNTFSIVKRLKALDLSYNNISQLNSSSFEGLVNLQTLKLQHLSNQTIRIEPSIFANLFDLSWLDLSRNHIKTINEGVFSGLISLRKLNLQQIKIDAIEQFAFAGLNHMTDLDLSCDHSSDPNSSCGIGVLDKQAFDNLTNLIVLNLANNAISQLNVGAFSKLEKLVYLNLSNTNLSEIKLGTFSHTKQLQSIDLSWNHFTVIDFALFLPRYLYLKSLYLNENKLNELEGFSQHLFPSLTRLGITGNLFNCTYLKAFLRIITVNHNITLVNDDLAPVNPHETNIHGIKCDLVDYYSNDSIASTTSTIKPILREDVLLKRENLTIFDTKQLTSSLTDAFSVFSQGQSDLHAVKSLLIVVCVLIAMLIFVVLVVNRDRILGNRRYAGFSRRNNGQSRTCIATDFEVSTFNQENNMP